MSATAVYFDPGTFVDRGLVERNMLAFLVEWIPVYLPVVERDKGLDVGSIARPKSFEVVNQFQRYPEDALPFIAVISPGFVPGRKPRREGDGTITAWWALAVGAVVSASDMRYSKDLAGYYGAAIRLAVMQVPTLESTDTGQWANGVELEDEKYDDFPRVQERSIAAVRVVFSVEVQNIMNVYGAPRDYVGHITAPPDPTVPPTPEPVVEQTPQYSISITTPPKEG